MINSTSGAQVGKASTLELTPAPPPGHTNLEHLQGCGPLGIFIEALRKMRPGTKASTWTVSTLEVTGLQTPEVPARKDQTLKNNLGKSIMHPIQNWKAILRRDENTDREYHTLEKKEDQIAARQERTATAPSCHHHAATPHRSRIPNHHAQSD